MGFVQLGYLDTGNLSQASPSVYINVLLIDMEFKFFEILFFPLFHIKPLNESRVPYKKIRIWLTELHWWKIT